MSRKRSGLGPGPGLDGDVLVCCRLLVLLLAGCGTTGTARGATMCGLSRDGEALLGALLPMHKGPGCSAVSVRGAQMEAALRSALDRVNRDLRREGISISQYAGPLAVSPSLSGSAPGPTVRRTFGRGPRRRAVHRATQCRAVRRSATQACPRARRAAILCLPALLLRFTGQDKAVRQCDAKRET